VKMTIHDDRDTGNASKTGRLVAAVKASIPALAFIVLLVLSSCFMSLPQARAAAPGSLIWSQTSNPSATDDGAYGVAVDGSGVYIVGFDYSLGNYEWRVEKRSLTDGSLIWSQTSNPSAGTDVARGVAVDGSGVYIVGYDYSPGNNEWRIEKRDLGLAGPGYYSVDIYVKDATSGRAIEGAQVFLDGVPRGFSNVMGLLTVVGVGSGTHTATASKSGYSASVETFAVTRATSVSVKMTPTVATNTATVRVYISGTSTGIPNALVYVDGAYAGATDASGQLVLTLNAGTHTFTVTRSGYITKSQTQTLAGFGPWTVTIYLAPR